MLRHLAARALHEPLLTLLAAGSPASERDSDGVVHASGRALRALLPGQPKPVAALTLAPEVTSLLLRALTLPNYARDEAPVALAAQVLFSLALSSSLAQKVTLAGPQTLEHGATRRGIRLLPGQQLLLDRSAIELEDEPLDPWGPELGALLTEQHGLALRRDAELDAGLLPAALEVIAERDPHAESVAGIFVALEVLPAADIPPLSSPDALPSAIGRARVPRDGSAVSLAHALLRESAFHKLTVLRLIDPLVHEERALPHLLQAADAWAGRRVRREPASAVSESLSRLDESALTPLGWRVYQELL